jgi:hypothetical protein
MEEPMDLLLERLRDNDGGGGGGDDDDDDDDDDGLHRHPARKNITTNFEKYSPD